MKYLTLSIPGFGKLDSDLPVPTGGFATGQNIVSALIEVALIIAIFFSLFTIIRGGINLISSGGQKEKFQQGRERIRYAIIGLVFTFISFFFINLLGILLDANLLSFPIKIP